MSRFIRNHPKEVAAQDLEALTHIADDVIESDFVPYACLFDPSTIVTKDAELLQTLKITGLGYDARSHGDLRSAVRQAIALCLPDARYAVWLHTLRRKQPAAHRPKYPDAFSGKLDEVWRAKQPASLLYANELYVSIVRASEPVSLLNRAVFKQALRPRKDRAVRLQALEEGRAELAQVTQALLSRLQPFGARLLGTVERKGIYYSEQLEFLEKLINLEERPMPLPDRDLSQALTSGEITFGYNAMEVRTAEGVRRFAALLTLKEYKESTLAGIDRFLEIPCELIISQCFDFAGREMARKEYEKQAEYLRFSGDREMAQWLEIERLMQEGAGNAKAFGQQQTSLFLIAPSIHQLDANLRMVQRALNRLGLVVVREDLRFEECYWAQLPANFPFIVRKKPVDTEHLAGFVNLQPAPMGNAAGSPWGAPVTLFTTLQDAPYYFNFHRGASAHTILTGAPGSGVTSFAHFLLAQARKLNPQLWYLDGTGRGKTLIEAMGGTYHQAAALQFNPLQMAVTPTNRDFLALWLSTLIDPTGVQLNAATLAFLQSVIDAVQQRPVAERRVGLVAAMLREADGLMGRAVAAYAEGGPYGTLFDAPEDRFAVAPLVGWELAPYLADPRIRVPLTSYVLHRISAALNGQPTLLALNEGFDLLDTPLYSMRVPGWLDYLSQQNAAAMLITRAPERAASYAYTPAIAARAATHFALYDAAPDAGYSMGFGLTAQEVATLSHLMSKPHLVLQKRGPEVVVIQGALDEVPPELRRTLAGKAKPIAESPAATLAALMGVV